MKRFPVRFRRRALRSSNAAVARSEALPRNGGPWTAVPWALSYLVHLTLSCAVIDGWLNQFLIVNEKGQLPWQLVTSDRYGLAAVPAETESLTCSMVKLPGVTPGFFGLVMFSTNVVPPLADLVM
jgi:hypothetical protein